MKKKWHINRRTFLKGAGYTLALPVLDIMILDKKLYAADNTPHLIFDIFPNGYYTRSNSGQTPKLPHQVLDPLKALGGDLSTVFNLKNNFKRPSSTETAHANGFLSFTRGRAFRGNNTNNKFHQDFTMTFDQKIATEVAAFRDSPMPTLSVSMDPPTAGSRPYHQYNVMSWQGPGKPVTPYSNPKYLFDKIFAFNPATRNLAGQPDPRGSMLDVINESIKALKAKGSANDKLRIEEYATSIREIEKQVNAVPPPQTVVCEKDNNLNKDIGNSNSSTYIQRLGVMQDLMVLAHQCEITRMSNIMRGYPSTLLNNSWISGIKGSSSWHANSHYDTPNYQNRTKGSLADILHDFTKILNWHSNNFVQFTQKLKSKTDPTGKNLLEKSLLVYGSYIGSGPWHDDHGMFFALAGQANGKMKSGVNIDKTQSINNLWLTIMKKYGVNVNKFGDSDSTIAQL